MIWHEIVWWFLKIYQDLKSFRAQEHKIVFVLSFRYAKQFYVPNMQEQSIEGKNQKSRDKHSSFDGLIQEDIDLSDIYYAVIKFMFIQLFSSQIILVFQGDLYVF